MQKIEAMRDNEAPAARIREEQEAYDETINNFNDNNVVLHVYFKSLGMVMFSREEIYTIVDLVGESKW